MESQEETEKLWRLRKATLQLCQDRGFLVDVAEIEQSLDQFIKNFTFIASMEAPTRNDLILLLKHSDNPSDQMFLFFAEELEIDLSMMKKYYDHMQLHKVRRGILVFRSRITSRAKQVADEMSPKYILEQFRESELELFSTKRELIPKHVIMAVTLKEKQELLLQLHLKEEDLLKINSTDPVARYYGLQKGQIVKVMRKSETPYCIIR